MSDTDLWDPTAYEADPRPTDEQSLASADERVAVIRNSDRVLFRRCRRRWGWSSHLRGNLGPKQNAGPLWYGTGFHFALEDFHGARKFPSAVDAFMAYTEATRRRAFNKLPGDWQELVELGKGMLSYYTDVWLSSRDPLTTFVYNGIPQVEVNFRIDIPWEQGRYGYDRVVYSGTLDRVVIDEHGQLWIVEYKTAKQIQTLHYAVDGQVSSYCWAGNHLYEGYKVAGVIYQQHRKDIPEEPKVLSTGKLSCNKQMLTTHRLYRRALINMYGEVKYAPKENVDFLNYLASIETPEQDRYVRRDRAFRNEHQCQAEGVKILLELEEMLNPDLPLYPNPSRDCAFLCPFSGPCVSLDDGSDWEYELSIMMEQRDRSYDLWRQYLDK